MENLQVNQMETQRPAMEQERVNFTRTTFNFFDGKAWCYKKMVEFKFEEWSKTELRPQGYYCYNCKNELIFKWKEPNYRDIEPFKFHKLLVKVLEKKDDDWRTGRKTHTYYAFCCKCAKADKSSGKLKKWAGRVREFEMEPCDCASFIEDKKREATRAIINYNEVIKDCDELKNELGKIREREKSLLPSNDEASFKEVREKGKKYNFKMSRLDDFIQQLEKRRSDAMESKHKEENYLLTYNEWETKRNQQLDFLIEGQCKPCQRENKKWFCKNCPESKKQRKEINN